MKLFKGKRALASGILVIMIVMFFAAFASVISLVMANEFTKTINSQSNETIPQDVKDAIASNTQFMNWGDKLFVMLFIVLLLTYIISSMTIEVNQPIFLFLFMGILVFVCFLAMWLSNSWEWIMQDADIALAAKDLKFTDHFMRNLPIITFIIGIMGAVLFYGRKAADFSSGGSGGDISGIE